MRTTELHEQITNIIVYMRGNTFVNTIYGGTPREFWPVGNGTRQEGMNSEIKFKIYTNEVLDAIMNLPVSCSLK